MPFENEKFGSECNHPAWKEGRFAFLKGRTLNDNPHPWGTEEFEAWTQGWHEAMTGQKRMKE